MKLGKSLMKSKNRDTVLNDLKFLGFFFFFFNFPNFRSMTAFSIDHGEDHFLSLLSFISDTMTVFHSKDEKS